MLLRQWLDDRGVTRDPVGTEQRHRGCVAHNFAVRVEAAAELYRRVLLGAVGELADRQHL